MILKIVIAFFLALLINKIIRNIMTNRKLTSGFPQKDRRELLWRYGPFVLSECIVEHHQAQIRKREIETGVYQPLKSSKPIKKSKIVLSNY